ncbi:MAG: ComF family protein [Burkholderiales bacterium]|nr:ComF family protein [Burkholderiales bacterium]
MMLSVAARIRAAVARVRAHDCLLCGAPGAPELVCAACAGDLPALPACCPVCAMPSPDAAMCGACLRAPPPFDATLALWRYEFPVDRLVHALKYQGRLPVARLFGDALARRAAARRVDAVVPMPLARRRLAERGFNQAVEIARASAAARRLAPACAAVERVRDTANQADLPVDARARNVRGAFACRGELAGLRVAVVDDVMTTGASLGELAACLKRAGVTWVENWVVGRTLPRDV